MVPNMTTDQIARKAINSCHQLTLQLTSLSRTSLKFKRDRDALLEACRAILSHCTDDDQIYLTICREIPALRKAVKEAERE